MVLQIKSGLHEREGKALTNFQRVLPSPDSDLAEQILKDPYNFDFLTVTEAAKEWEIERGLAASAARSAAGTGPGLCLRRQPGAVAGRRSGLLS